MGCSCPFATVEALRSGPSKVDSNPRTRARLDIDRAALRHLLNSRAEVVEAMALAAMAPEASSPKATGRPSANVSVLWRFYTSSVYRSGDLPAIATREALQNAVDAIRAAVRTGQLKTGDGRFEVSWDESERSLTFADNGIGMTADDVLNKFLSLGTSGKGSAASSDDAAGGFGVAKAVILGTSDSYAEPALMWSSPR